MPSGAPPERCFGSRLRARAAAARPARVRAARTLPAGARPARATLLDVGCGEGCSPPSSRAPASRGGDRRRRGAAASRSRARPGARPAARRRRRPWPLPDASFDAVWAGETIEHVPTRAAGSPRFVACCARRASAAEHPRTRAAAAARLALSRRAFERTSIRAPTTCASTPAGPLTGAGGVRLPRKSCTARPPGARAAAAARGGALVSCRAPTRRRSTR